MRWYDDRSDPAGASGTGLCLDGFCEDLRERGNVSFCGVETMLAEQSFRKLTRLQNLTSVWQQRGKREWKLFCNLRKSSAQTDSNYRRGYEVSCVERRVRGAGNLWDLGADSRLLGQARSSSHPNGERRLQPLFYLNDSPMSQLPDETLRRVISH